MVPHTENHNHSAFYVAIKHKHNTMDLAARIMLVWWLIEKVNNWELIVNVTLARFVKLVTICIVLSLVVSKQ